MPTCNFNLIFKYLMKFIWNIKTSYITEILHQKYLRRDKNELKWHLSVNTIEHFFSFTELEIGSNENLLWVKIVNNGFQPQQLLALTILKFPTCLNKFFVLKFRIRLHNLQNLWNFEDVLYKSYQISWTFLKRIIL